LNTRYVLIDFENVQPKDVASLNGESLKIKVFVGSHQAKIPLELAHSLQPFGHDAEYIKVDGDGKNALDFHIAYYIGCLATEAPKAVFHLVSKDSGFDPLIKHLKSKGIKCSRTASLAGISPKPKMPNGNIDAVIAILKKCKSSRPGTLAKLQNTVMSLFKNGITETDADEVIKGLKARGVIKVSGEQVEYFFQ
jgi:hypothetical protein